MKAAQKKIATEAFEMLEKARDMLTELAQELRDAIDEKSDKWRESEKGEEANAEQEAIEQASSDCESAIDHLIEAGI